MTQQTHTITHRPLPRLLFAIHCSAILLSPVLSAGEFIRQQQIETGLTWDCHVSSESGNRWSPIPATQGGTRLMLFAQGSGSDTRLYQLDATTLGDGFPTAEIVIQSEDPHDPPRTRADKPFSVSLTTRGLQRSGKPTAIHHHGITYQNSIHAPASHSAVEDFGWWTLSQEGEQGTVFYPSLNKTDPTHAEGKETFTAYSYCKDPITGKNVKMALRSASIEVWPVAKATIHGLPSGSTLSAADLKKAVHIQCEDLYPDSVTYLQIYHGKARLGRKGTILPQSVIRFDSSVPQDQTIPLGECRDTLADGTYTIEVLTITPFNRGKPERLAHTTFIIDRGMHAPNMVSQ
ncbi:MAG: hypothetical protein KJO79_08085 [Verrucomicrobiae bacterium]|nr:hypothetical protein [Verrucomicrobiae bacterium]NNJ87124.1 hypothetical protein [Akkermansiaceae bacterium]